MRRSSSGDSYEGSKPEEIQPNNKQESNLAMSYSLKEATQTEKLFEIRNPRVKSVLLKLKPLDIKTEKTTEGSYSYLGPREFKDGSIFVGSWHKDLRQGYGKHLWDDGTCIEGSWENGKAEGLGRVIYPSGDY